MNLSEQRRLKFDRRMQDRRDWVSDDELAAELEGLPDVSDKVAREEETAEASAPGAAESPEPTPPGIPPTGSYDPQAGSGGSGGF